MSVTLVLWAAAVIALSLALFFAMIRLLGGPNTLDRMISLDTLAAIAQCGLGVYIAWTMDTTPAAALVALALVAFLGSVSVARFRVDDTKGVPDQPVGPPGGAEPRREGAPATGSTPDDDRDRRQVRDQEEAGS